MLGNDRINTMKKKSCNMEERKNEIKGGQGLGNDSRIVMGGAMGKVGLVCLFWFLSLGASGQSVVTGMVADSTGEGIVGAAVVVMDAADTTSIAWEYSQEDGRFWVQYHCQEGKEVLLFVQAYGYRSCYLPLAGKEVEDVGKLTLGGWHVGLGEVAVQGEMPIRYKFVRGRDEFQIPQHVEEQAFDVNGVLRQIPGLEVKGESVSIVGRGSPKFTINGMEPRPGELEQLSPRDIEKVYIDRTPSSRYGKEVKGVIDIVTRKRLKDGLNMRLYNNFWYKSEPSDNANVTVNQQAGRWTNYLNYGYNYTRSRQDDRYAYVLHLEDEDFERIYTQQPLYVSRNHRLTLSPKFVVDEKSFVDLQYQGYIEDMEGEQQETFEVVGEERSATEGVSDKKRQTHHVILRYVREVEDKSRLAVNAGYSTVRERGHQLQDERVMPEDGRDTLVHTDYSSRTVNDAVTLSADYEHYFENGLSFDAGLSFAELWSDGWTDYKGGAYYSTSTEETQAAVYADFSQEVGKFSYRVGVRGEYLYKYRAEDTEANEHPFSFLPSVDMSYALSDEVNFNAYFRRSTVHPTLRERDPVLYYVNKYEYVQGNPDLKSYIENELYFGVRLPRNFACHLNYYFAKNPIIQMDDIYDAATKTTVLTYHNFPKKKELSAEVSWNGRWGFYSLFLTGKYGQCWSKSPFEGGYASFHKPMFGVYVQQSARIAKNISATVTFDYYTSSDDMYSRNGEAYSLSANVNMALFQRRVNVFIACNDMLHTDYRSWEKYKSISTDNFTKNYCSFSLGISLNVNNFKNVFRSNDADGEVWDRLQ